MKSSGLRNIRSAAAAEGEPRRKMLLGGLDRDSVAGSLAGREPNRPPMLTPKSDCVLLSLPSIWVYNTCSSAYSNNDKLEPVEGRLLVVTRDISNGDGPAWLVDMGTDLKELAAGADPATQVVLLSLVLPPPLMRTLNSLP